MARTPETKVKFSIFNKEFREGITEINKDTTKMRKEFKLQAEQMKHTSSETGKLEQNIKRLSREKENVQRKIKLTEKQLRSAKEYYGENSEEARRLENQLLDLQISEQKIANAIHDSNVAIEDQQEAMKDGTSRAKKYADSIVNAGKKISDVGKGIQDVGKGISSFGKSWSMNISTPIVAGGGLVYKAADVIDKALKDIRMTTGKTGEEFEDLEKSFRNVFREATDSAETVSEVMGALNVSTEATGEELEKLTNQTLDYAKVNKTEASTSAKTLGRLMNALEVDVRAMPGVMDKLTKAAQMSGIGVNELTEYVIDAGPAFEEMGFDLDRSIALFSSFHKVGANPKEVLSSLNIVLNRMAKDGAKNAESAFNKLLDEIKAAPDILSATTIASEAFGSKIGAKVADDIRAGHFEVDEWVKALQNSKNVVKETAEETETFGEKMSRLKNRATLALEPLGIALVNALESALTALEPLIEKVEQGAQAFADMTEEEQQAIIKKIALVAAIGPVIVIVGNLVTIIGGAVRIAGNLVTVVGHLGRAMSLLGKAGPVGIAIAGITGLSWVIGGLTSDKKKLHDINYDLVDGLYEEVDAMDEVINRFENLQAKNQLTTDEVLRYMDIMDELEKNHSEETLKKLSDEQANLLKKSGLTNDEMEDFLSLNDTIVEKSPNTVNAISEQGNAYAQNLEEVKKLNEEERKNLALVMHREVEKALENEVELRKEYNELTQEQSDLYDEIGEKQKKNAEIPKKLNAYEKTLKDIKNEIKKTEEEMLELSGEDLENAHRKKLQLEGHLVDYNAIIQHLGWEEENNKTIIDQNIEKIQANQTDIEQKEEQLKKTNDLIADYEALILAQADITSEKGRGLDAIDEELEKNKKLRQELQSNHDAQEIGTEEYRLQNDQLNEQDRKLNKAKEELEKINKLAEETGYSKEIDLFTDPSVDRINSLLSSPIKRTMFVATQYGESPMKMYAKGTKWHPGGPAILGEEGPELVREGQHWSVRTLGLYNDLKRGAQVFTAKQTKRMLSMIPKYADGAGVSRQMARNLQATSQNLAVRQNSVNNQVVVSVEASDVIIDGRVVGHITWKTVKEKIDRSTARKRGT